MELFVILLLSLFRFAMNGKGLCLMTLEMFTERVPLGGKLLYKDFRIRLAEAIPSQLQYSSTSKLLYKDFRIRLTEAT